jgi:hypothetical protein
MPLEYFFFLKNNTPRRFMGKGTHWHISLEPFTLKDLEILDLKKFVQDTKLPFQKRFLQLAFENFELSYHTQDTDLAFLSLISGLEALFNRGEQEISYTIARNTAVLLGDKVKDSEEIYHKVRELYRMRSQIVHVGKKKIVKKENLLELRSYTRESIKELYNTGRNKDDVLDLLNSSGFGDRSWRGKELF